MVCSDDLGGGSRGEGKILVELSVFHTKLLPCLVKVTCEATVSPASEPLVRYGLRALES